MTLFYEIIKMKYIVLFALFILISCKDHFTPTFSEKLDEPQIYLSQDRESVGLKDLNRDESQFLLLSDKIIFPKKTNVKKPDPLSSWKTLDSLKPEDIKIKISSFCSWTKQETNSEERLVREMASSSYHRSFSVLELVPKKVLLSSPQKTFYCSFIFAFKNESGLFDHYSINQQSIHPLFAVFEDSPRPHQELSLIRETAEGYLPIQNKVIKKEDLSKITLFDRSEQSVKNYLLFCEGLKALNIPGNPTGLSPAFVHLSQAHLKDAPQGLSLCRFFSEDKNGKTLGISSPFQIDFASLQEEEQTPLDLEALSAPKLISPDYSKILSGRDPAPLNSWFQFQGLEPFLGKSDSSIDIEVTTYCSNRKNLGRGQVVVESYRFPFQTQFPLMAVTPKPLFLLDTVSTKRWEGKKERFRERGTFSMPRRQHRADKATCLYEIQLKSPEKPKVSKKFPVRHQDIIFSNGSYGIDYNPLSQYPFINPVSPNRSRSKYFLSLRDLDQAGHFHFVFESPSLANHTVIECHGGKDSKKTDQYIKISLDLSSVGRIMSAKALFLNPELKEYIDRKTMAACRLFIYKNNIIQSFSGEMKIMK